MDATALLIADHNRVRGLFARFDAAKEADDAGVMAEVVETIAHELEVHTTIEEEVFYPWARDLSDEIRATIDEGLEEHHVVNILLQEIKALEPGSDAWVAKVTVVIESVDHHAGEEEAEMFPKVRGAATAADREAQGARLEARKSELGAPVLADKIDMTTDALHKLATAQHVPGRSTMSHEELAATVAPD